MEPGQSGHRGLSATRVAVVASEKDIASVTIRFQCMEENIAQGIDMKLKNAIQRTVQVNE